MAKQKNFTDGLTSQLEDIQRSQSAARDNARSKTLDVVRTKKMAVFVEDELWMRLHNLSLLLSKSAPKGEMVSCDVIIYNAVLEWMNRHEKPIAEGEKVELVRAKTGLCKD